MIHVIGAFAFGDSKSADVCTMGLIMAILNVKGVREIAANFNEYTANQAPFAMAKALTATVKSAQQAVTEHMGKTFDQPTNFTMRAIAFAPARKDELRAKVFVKAIQASYLVAEMQGGIRGFKSFEEKFGGREFAMPGRDVKRNQSGNMSKAQIIKIAANVENKQGYKPYFKAKSKTNPAVSIIYARATGNKKAIPQLIFTNMAMYQPRFKFQEVARQTVDATFTENFQKAWDSALSSMRR